MNKEEIKFLFEIYSDLLKEKIDGMQSDDYNNYDIEPIMEKIKQRIDSLLVD